MSFKDDKLDFATPPHERIRQLTQEALLAKEEQLKAPETTSELEPAERETSYQFGYRIPFLPDFLLDHTLLEKEPHERITEHCRRWTQFIAGLWREVGVTFAMVYQWQPVSKNASAHAAKHAVGAINIYLLGRVNRNTVREDISREVALALQTFGFSPHELSTAEVEQITLSAAGEAFEVRQRDNRVTVNTEFIERYHANDLPPEKLQTIRRGVYTVSPWSGAGGSHLVPFQVLVAQAKPVSIWVLLRPVSLNEIARGRAWFIEWSRLLAKWADDSAAADIVVTRSQNLQVTEQESTTSTHQKTETQSENDVTGESGDKWFWDSWNTSKALGSATANSTSTGSTRGSSVSDQKGVSISEGNRTFTSKDLQAKWLANESAAFFRKLTNPFYATVYCFSEDGASARAVANAIASTVSEEALFDASASEAAPRGSSAEMVPLEEGTKQAAWHACRTISLEPSQVQSSSQLMPGEPTNLNYIVDARAAATVFRFPVNVRGGIPGIQIKQQAPDFHPGEIHLTAPKGCITFGNLSNFGLAFVDAKAFKKHALITGFTGSGKTVTVLNLLHQFWLDCNVPFLVIESAKQEYRGLLGVEGFKDTDNLRVYTLGNELCAPFRLNPFELLPGVRVEAHISRLQTCFEGALPPIGPLSSLIYEALFNIYRKKGWQLTDQFPAPGTKVWRKFPTMSDFADEMGNLIVARGYKGDVRDNLKAAINGRIKPLTLGSKGRMFNTENSIPAPAELFSIPTILELNDLNQDDKALVVMFLLTLLREFRETETTSIDELKHVTVVEEAHNVLENVSSKGTAEGSSADTRYKAVQAFCNMLAEIRALGEGLIIADQSPEKLAPDAMRNTNVQIAHQLRDSRDREAIARAMIMDQEQCDFLGKLETGNAALFVTGLQKATFIQVPKFYPSAEDKRFKAGESVQEQNARLRKQFRGLGFGPVKDERLKAYMDDLTKPLRRLDLPFAGCNHCKASGCYRDAMFVLAQNKALNTRFRKAYELTDKEARRKRDQTVENFWREVVSIANDAATLADASGNLEAGWCFLVHAWDAEERRVTTGKIAGLTENHRAPFERNFNALHKSE